MPINQAAHEVPASRNSCSAFTSPRERAHRQGFSHFARGTSLALPVGMSAKLALLLALALPDTVLPDWDGAAPPSLPTKLMARPDALLLGTDSGLYERRGDARGWRLVLARDGVRDLAPTSGGALVASGGGLFEWNADGNGARELMLGAGAETRGVASDARGTAWIATAAGLYRRDAGARDFVREAGLPAGEVSAVANAGDELWVAIDGALWSGSREAGFRQRMRGLEEGWWELCGAVVRPASTLLCVPGGVWRVDASGARRIELAAGRLFALAAAGERLFAAGEGGLSAWCDSDTTASAGRQELSVPAYGLAVAGDDLLVATERGVAAFALAAKSPPVPRAASEPDRGLRIAPQPARSSQIQQVQRAVLAYLELSPSRMLELDGRARRAGLMPELRAVAGYARDTSRGVDHDEVFVSGVSKRLFDSGNDKQQGYDVAFTLTWDFAALASPDDALAISRERRSLVTLRDQVLERVNHLYFQRLRVLAQLDALDAADAAKRTELELDAAEISAQLDAWSGGLFSRLETVSPPDAQRESR
jgi:hypothetical protein